VVSELGKPTLDRDQGQRLAILDKPASSQDRSIWAAHSVMAWVAAGLDQMRGQALADCRIRGHGIPAVEV